MVPPYQSECYEKGYGDLGSLVYCSAVKPGWSVSGSDVE